MNKPRIIRSVLPIALVAAILTIWQIASMRSMINPALFSAPSEIVLAMVRGREIGHHMGHSIYRLFVSVGIGSLIGFFVGLGMGKQKNMNFMDDIVNFFISIPGIAWGPLFIILLGFGDVTILSVGVLTSFFPVVLNTAQGFKEIPTHLKQTACLFEYRPWQTLLYVEIPGMIPYLIQGLREALSRCWRTIIAVEMVAATLYGLGYTTFKARELLNTDIMFAGLFLSGLCYLAIELLLFKPLEHFTLYRWGIKNEASK